MDTDGRGAQAEAGKEGTVLSPEQKRARRARNIAIGVGVSLLVVLFYAVTIVRLGGAVANRTI
jgi:predicted nucleic acid-binding Zn ribbon protein